MGISFETIWPFTNAPNGHYSKVQDLKNNPATIKNIWINRRRQWLPFPYWIHGRVEEYELLLLCGWFSVQITHLYSFPFSHDEPYWEQLYARGKKGLPPSLKLLSNGPYTEYIWDQGCAGHPRNNRKQAKTSLSRIWQRYLKITRPHVFGEKSASGWFNTKSGRLGLKENYTSN